MSMRSVVEMVEAARAEIVNLTPGEARRRVQEEGALIVDIRDVRELEREGVIPAAMHAPRGMLEFWVSPDSPYAKDVFAEDREFILCCQSGWRSALSTKTLRDMGLTRVGHVESGFAGWRDSGEPVVDYETWKAERVR